MSRTRRTGTGYYGTRQYARRVSRDGQSWCCPSGPKCEWHIEDRRHTNLAREDAADEAIRNHKETAS